MEAGGRGVGGRDQFIKAALHTLAVGCKLAVKIHGAPRSGVRGGLANGFGRGAEQEQTRQAARPEPYLASLFRMPTYEYICTKCGHEMEAFQAMKEAPHQRCPACRKTALRRLVGGGAGLIFKGSGFYITDYRRQPAAKADAAAAKPSVPPTRKPAVPAAAK